MNLTKIANGLRLIADGLDDSTDVPVPEKPKQEKPKQTRKPKPDPKPEPAPEKSPTKEDVMNALQPLAAAGGAKMVKALLLEFNVPRVSELDESDYADCIEMAEAKLAKLKQ